MMSTLFMAGWFNILAGHDLFPKDNASKEAGFLFETLMSRESVLRRLWIIFHHHDGLSEGSNRCISGNRAPTRR